MPGFTKEVHSTILSIHTLVVDGVEFVEEKKTTTVTSKDSGTKLGEIISHKRQIGDKSVTLTQENGEKKEETDLTDEERKEFDSDWNQKWRPTLKYEEVEKMLD